MAKKVAQIQFKKWKVEQNRYYVRRTSLTRTEPLQRTVFVFILQFREHRYKLTMIPLPTLDAKDAR